MKTTDCLGLPYPECAPPLVKDASDIKQFRDLAEATDAAVQDFADTLTTELLSPPAAKMSGGSNTAGTDVTHFFGVTTFDNAGMADLTLDGIVIPEDGWYMVGGTVRASFGAMVLMQLRVDPLVNGEPWTSRQGPGHFNASSEDVSFADTGFFRAGDFLNFMTHHTASAATVFSYSTRFWVLQVLSNV